MTRVKFKYLRQYINVCESLVSEYEQLGGQRDDAIVHSLFLSSIPDTQYSAEKHENSETTLDMAFEYFRKMIDRHQTYQAKTSFTTVKAVKTK